MHSIVEPFLACPRFTSCGCNDCPLDPLAAMHGGARHAVRGEERCRARRAVREHIVAALGLPPGFAVLPRERNRDARAAAFAALPEEDRARRVTQLTAARRRALRARDTGVLEARGAGKGDGAGREDRSQNPVSCGDARTEREVGP